MNKFFLFFVIAIATLVSCKGDNKTNYNKGELVVSVDPSSFDIADALSYRYMKAYPEAKITIKQQKEREGLKDLLEGRIGTIIMSRELSDGEKITFKQKYNFNPKPAYFAADALVFVVPKESSINTISVEEVKKMLTDGKRNLIFDGANGSNIDYIADRLGMKTADMQYSSLKTNEEIINDISQYNDHIGVVSLNTISRPYGEKAQVLRDKVKIITVSEKDGPFSPERTNLKNMKYPFTRYLYFLTSEGNFGIANGFIRYSCTQIGQMIVDKNGLQPYNLYPREVRIVE